MIQSLYCNNSAKINTPSIIYFSFILLLYLIFRYCQTVILQYTFIVSSEISILFNLGNSILPFLGFRIPNSKSVISFSCFLSIL